MCVNLTFDEYVRPIYEKWDREKSRVPPKGFSTWVEYLDKRGWEELVRNAPPFKGK